MSVPVEELKAMNASFYKDNTKSLKSTNYSLALRFFNAVGGFLYVAGSTAITLFLKYLFGIYLDLDLVKVDLSGNSKNMFISAAFSFIPPDAPVFYQTTWDFLYVLLLEGTPIALFSPLTLVCPAKQFRKKSRG